MPSLKEVEPPKNEAEATVALDGETQAIDGPVTVGSREIAGIKIVSASKPSEFLKILVYGEPGVGKTVLAGSAAAVKEMGPVLLIDVEGGALSLRDFYPQVDVVRAGDYQEIRKVGGRLRESKGGGYRTVIIDSLSEASRLSMLTIMQAVVLERPDRDPDIPSVKEWGKNIEQVRRLVRFFRDLPMHVIFTCHETEHTDERTNLTKTKPSLSGKLSNEVAGFVDEVWYYYTKAVNNKVQRLLLTGPEGSKIAKDRSNRLPLVVPEPTMELIYNAVYNEKPIAS